MSKGDNRRPAAVPEKVYQDNWEKTFGKKELPCNCPTFIHASGCPWRRDIVTDDEK